MKAPTTFQGQRGATVIEFAFVAFIFFLLIWGYFEFARAFYVRNTTQHLTRCMARAAVVYPPSQSALAKRECLMGDDHTWPFFLLSSDDLTDSFQLAYLMTANVEDARCPDETSHPTLCLTESAVSSGYDDQATACASGTSTRCIYYVRAYYAGGPVAMFGLLSAWIGVDERIAEPPAATTVPAENMGWLPP
jgi:hypothetical protein